LTIIPHGEAKAPESGVSRDVDALRDLASTSRHDGRAAAMARYSGEFLRSRCIDGETR
jgi:hypothetical protein